MKTKQWAWVPVIAALAVMLGGCSSSDKSADEASSAAASVAGTATSTVTKTAAASTVTSTATSTETTTDTPIGGDIVAPVTVDANALQGTTVQLVVGQVLNINTGSLPVDSYQGQIANSEIAMFTPGRIGDTAQFNPGVTAVSPGATQVTLTNSQGGIQPVTFVVSVSPR